VTFGREKKRAGIVIFDKDKPIARYVIVELKRPRLKDGKEHLKSYCNATGAPMGVWTNGESISHYHRGDPNCFEDIPVIPSASRRLTGILTKRWTMQDLVMKDKLVNKRKSFKDLILEMEGEALAGARVDVFEKLFNNYGETRKIELTASRLSICISSPQGVKLFNSNLDVVDGAFECLVNKSGKG
jgi:type I restriction enzyme M protein